MRRSDYNFERQLGRGSFGVVYRVQRKSDGRHFVCKQIQVQGMSKKAREEADQEVTILRKVSSGSDYIVQYIASFLEGDFLHIIMEFCENGDLGGFLKVRAGTLIEERTVWKFLIQISLGLRWLHRNRVLHRDIKTLNVFLTSVDDVRLGDLGVARVLSHNTQFASTFIGTPYYLSPELCEEKPYNELSDVWAFGCVVYEMCTLKHPFDARNQAALLIKILRGQYAPISRVYSDDLRDLIDGCMRRDWTKRMKLVDMLATPSIANWAGQLVLALDSERARVGAKPAAASHTRSDVQGGKPYEFKASPRGAVVRAGSKNADAPAKPASKVAAPVPARRNADQAGLPRARVRGDPRASAGCSAPAKTIVAPSVANPAAQVIRAPGRMSAGGGASRAQLAPAPVPPKSSSGGGGGGAQRFSAQDRAEERRRAAREVAELPDVVGTAASARSSRNVPSVHELLRLEAEPSASGTLPTMEPLRTHLSSRAAMPDVLHQAAQTTSTLRDQATLLPDEVEEPGIDDETLLPHDRNDGVEVGLDDDEACSVASSGARPPSIPSGLRLLHPVSSSGEEPLASQLRLLQPLQSSKELTHCSVFDESSCGNTLTYTQESTMLADSSFQLTSTGAVPSLDIVVDWNVDAEDALEHDSDFDALSCSAKIDNDGLLCDAQWSGLPERSAQQGSVAVGEMMGSLESEHCPCDAQGNESSDMALEHNIACNPLLLPPVLSSQCNQIGPDPQLQLARLSTQISRLYNEVVRVLDVPARAVWDDLYHLFQAKMTVELTDEDQSEIERYVFEQLPTENTDLIWKVYKVLHLEQERERWQKIISAR